MSVSGFFLFVLLLFVVLCFKSIGGAFGEFGDWGDFLGDFGDFGDWGDFLGDCEFFAFGDLLRGRPFVEARVFIYTFNEIFFVVLLWR